MEYPKAMKRSGFKKPDSVKPTLRKPRKCCICKTSEVANKFAKLCVNVECVIQFANKERAKRLAKEAAKANKEHRAKVLKSKPLSYWLKRTEAVCNRFVRLRDDADPCISCGATTSYPRWQAGHYVSVGGNSTLRFDPDNIHKQCVHCNMHKGGNAIMYRVGLVKKIGIERVERLESFHAPVKRTVDDVQAIELHYKNLIKELGRDETLPPVIESMDGYDIRPSEDDDNFSFL